MSNNVFHCRYRNCQYYSVSFNRLLNHIWDRHKNDLNFKYVCGISNCTSSYANQQSFRRHAKSKHKRFFEQHMKFFNSKTNDNTNFLEGNANGGDDYEEINNNDNDVSDLNETESIESSAEGYLEDAAGYSFDNIDFNKLIGEKLLDLRENFNVTTAATCKISEFLMDVIQIDSKIFSNAIKKSLAKNFCSQNYFLYFETKEILHSESPFYQACSKFCGEKALSNYFKPQKLYLEPAEKVVGFDHEKVIFSNYYCEFQEMPAN